MSAVLAGALVGGGLFVGGGAVAQAAPTTPTAAPAIYGLSTQDVPDSGGATVSLRGSGFTGATTVTVGTTPARSFRVVDDDDLDLVVPPGAGLEHLVVTTPAGSSRIEDGTSLQYDDTGRSDGFTSVTPVRVLDTRTSEGGTGPFTSGVAYPLDVSAAVPADARAVVLSLIGVAPTVETNLSISGSASVLNVKKGEVLADQVVAYVGRDRTVLIHNAAGSVDVVADLVGYLSPSATGTFVPHQPQRVVDTRTGLGLPRALAPASSTQLDLSGLLPAGATAVSFTLTGVAPTATTFVSVGPRAGTPTTSNLNLVPGDTAAVHVTAALAADRSVSLYNARGTTDVVVDVDGWYVPGSGALVHPVLVQSRLEDTRTDGTTASRTIAAPALPSAATAAIVTITAVGAEKSGVLTAYAPGTARPLASVVNVAPRQTRADLAVVPVRQTPAGPSIQVDEVGQGLVPYVVDLDGWVEPRAPVVALSPPSTSGTAGLRYDQPLTATGGTEPYTWSASGLPKGLAVSGSSVAGAPASAGTASVTLTVTDAAGQRATQTQTISVGPTAPLDEAPSALSGVTSMTRSQHFCVTDTAGEVLCNDQMVDSPHAVARDVPTVKVAGGFHDAVSVASTAASVCAVRSSGAVGCFGNDTNGQLGDGGAAGTATTFTAVPVTGLSDATALVSSESVTCALRRSGAVVCWGTGNHGELGNGTTGVARTPVGVSGLTDAVALAASSLTVCALRSGGTVVCWGSSAFGALGDGTNGEADTAVPRAVPGVAGATSITSYGTSGTCVRSASGTTTCWGGWLGEDADVADDEPVHQPLQDGSGPVSLASDCAANGGRVACGVLVPGDGHTDAGIPVRPVTTVGLVDAAGPLYGDSAEVCALRSAGEVACWGTPNSYEHLVHTAAPTIVQVD